MAIHPFLLLLHPTSWAVHAFATESWHFKSCLVVNRRTWKGMSHSKGLQASQYGRWVLCSFHFPFITSFSFKEHITRNGPVSCRRKWLHSLWIMVSLPDCEPLITPEGGGGVGGGREALWQGMARGLGGIREAFFELQRPKWREGTSPMTISGKSFWAERIVSAVLQAYEFKDQEQGYCVWSQGGKGMSLERYRGQIGPYKPW